MIDTVDKEMTPLHIRILLHFNSRRALFPNAGRVEFECINHLVEWGLIEATEEQLVYSCTQKGRAHIAQMTRLPLPKQAWIDYNGKPIAI